MSAAETLLSRLDGVKKRGPGRWLAKCPAHDDRNPSLSVAETDDGKTLVHCFSACSPSDILAAVGLDMSDLFPERPADERRRRYRPQFTVRDVLDVLDQEALIVLAVAQDLRRGVALPPGDFERLAMAANRIARLREVAT